MCVHVCVCVNGSKSYGVWCKCSGKPYGVPVCTVEALVVEVSQWRLSKLDSLKSEHLCDILLPLRACLCMSSGYLCNPDTFFWSKGVRII